MRDGEGLHGGGGHGPRADDPATRATRVALGLVGDADGILSPERLLELVVGGFSDWGTVHLVQSDGTLRRVAAHHRDPDMAQVIARLRESPSIDPRTAPDLDEPLRTRRAVVRHRSVDELRRLAPTDDVHRAWVELGFASGVLLPLVVGDRPLGVLALMAASPTAFDDDEVAALEGLSYVCALLVETARVAREAEAEQGERVRVRAVLDSLLAHAPVATVVVDTERRVLHHNDLLRQVTPVAVPPTGDAAPAVVGAVPLEELVPGLADEMGDLVAPILEGAAAVAAVEICTGPPEHRRDWTVRAFPIRRSDDALFGAGIIVTEVTDERQESRRELESRARLELSLDAGGMGTWDWDLGSNQVTVSSGMERLIGLQPGTFDGSGPAFIERVHPDDRDSVRHELLAAVDGVADYADEFRVLGHGDESRWLETRGRVVATSEGVAVRMIGVAIDVTERHHVEDVKVRLLEREYMLRKAAEAATARQSLRADVGVALAGMLEPAELHLRLASVLVPALADWCILDALDDDGELQEMAADHIDPSMVPLIRELRQRRREAGGDGIWSIRRTVRTGFAELVTDIDDEDLVETAIDEDHLAVLRALAPRSAATAPLIARGRVLGGITLVRSRAVPFEEDDRALVEDIAARAATAIDAAVLIQSRIEVSRALQRTLLPPALPEIPGVELSADYQVAETGIEIGGDFYDVFETESGWHVVLGDVCGKGPDAAGLTGLFRHTLRAVAPAQDEAGEPAPTAILAATNDAILGQLDDSRFATAVLVKLHPGAGSAVAEVACAGHPRPLVVRADGTVEVVEASGTLLGILPDPELHEARVSLGRGDSLVLYTDGVTEARRGGELLGEQGLVDALAAAAGLTSAAAVTEAVTRAVDDFRDGTAPGDDVAVVTVRVPLDDEDAARSS